MIDEPRKHNKWVSNLFIVKSGILHGPGEGP